MVVEEFFTGQHILTQGELGETYFVLRRGKCSVFVDQKQVNTIRTGMGFGEVALVLDTHRTATVEAITPCEVFMLSRHEYEAVVNSMPPERRQSALSKIVDKFWQLMQNENSGRHKVDFATYLQLHLRVSRTLSEGEVDFVENEERECAQEEWSEDCARAGLKDNAELDFSLFANSLVSAVGAT
jgi:CRP-like cAMP-binding protein